MSDLFPSPTTNPPFSTPLPELEDVEERLLQIMEDEFEVVVDDDSSLEVARQIMTLWGQTSEGDFSGVVRLQEEYARRGARGGAETIRAAVVEGDGDDSVDEEEWSGEDDDDDEGDVEMGDADAPPRLRERPAPEVDDEGFTTVKRRGR